MSKARKAKAQREPDAWLCGYAAALAAAWRNYHCDQTVTQTLVGDGLRIEDFEKGGVEEYDLSVLRKLVHQRGET